MQSSAYNNPLFAQGLAGLVKGFIGTPEGAGRAELLAAQALNENLTAQYRQAMDVGLQDADTALGQMMIRALQAGNQYSGNAPKIGAAVRADNSGRLGAGGSRGGRAIIDVTQIPEQLRNDAREAISQGADAEEVRAQLGAIMGGKISGVLY